jgi:hypothetical protein
MELCMNQESKTTSTVIHLLQGAFTKHEVKAARQKVEMLGHPRKCKLQWRLAVSNPRREHHPSFD